MPPFAKLRRANHQDLRVPVSRNLYVQSERRERMREGERREKERVRESAFVQMQTVQFVQMIKLPRN
jgi:hypothetical protein